MILFLFLKQIKTNIQFSKNKLQHKLSFCYYNNPFSQHHCLCLMFNRYAKTSFRFCTSKKNHHPQQKSKLKKSEVLNNHKLSPQLNQKIQILKQMKQYMIPFMHNDKRITIALIKSYGYLACSKICFFGGPLFLKYGINALQNTTLTMADPLWLFFGYGLCYSLSVLFQSLRNMQTVKIVNMALVQTASHAYKHMLSLGPEFFFSGSQRHRLFNLYKAQTAIQQNLKSFTQYFLPIALDVVLSAGLLLYYSGSPFVISFLTCYAFYSVFTIKYSDRRKKSIKQQRQCERKLDFITSQTFANYFNVKYFRKQEDELEKYKKGIEQYYQKTMVTQRGLGILNTVQRFIFGAGLTFNMLMAAYYTQKGLMSTGDIIMIQTLMMQLLNPLFFLGSMYRGFSDSFIDVKQLRDILRLPARVIEGTENLTELRGDIQFDNISFKYIDHGNQVMEKLSFKVKQGQFVAIVGESGAGKSTILNLMFRLYDPSAGQIKIDGVDIKKLTFDFRKQISFVSQAPYLFNGTVMENLTFGHPTVHIQQVMKLTKKFNLHETIMKLPNGYNTNVGQKGNIFSGGQKQRISLIRALLKKAKIILLDEPTSSLDLQTQKIIAQTLFEYKNCTRIMITHRQALLKYCNQVIKVKKIKKNQGQDNESESESQEK